ncbi:MAG: DUF2271 domain-containing protein [Verrucomicrobiota bacterium]
MNFKTLICGLALGLSAIAVQANESSSEFAFQHEHVLGTSFELRLNADSADIATSAEKAALAEIDRLAKILSRHHAKSELMRWQSASPDQQLQVSDDLGQVLNRAEYWRQKTTGAFDVRPADLVAPNSSPYTLAASGKVHRHDEMPISLDGLAKGYIIDRVCDSIRKQFPNITNFSVNIGGDVRKVGDRQLPIAITNPFDAAEGSKPIDSFVASQPVAVATSGGYRRESHILDPRTGSAASKVASATVIAPTAVDADALATSLCVLSATEGVAIAESLENVECLIVLTNGRQMASQGWPGNPNDQTFEMVSNASKSGLVVDFKLNRPKGGRYRRPYVAVWLEDQDGYPVKTAVLWMQTERPGPRWHRDLTRWYRNDRTRKPVEKSDLIGVISGATRGPGKYEARFHGNDNAGDPLPEGKYTLCLEVAREHGTYQIIRESVMLG